MDHAFRAVTSADSCSLIAVMTPYARPLAHGHLHDLTGQAQ